MALGPEVLKVIRDNGALDEDDLTELLGARGSRLMYGLSASIRSLESAGLVQRSGKTLQVTELWEKVQQALNLSLTELADLQDGSATILHPLFGPAEPPRPGAHGLDIFVLMPFTAELKTVFDDHIRKTAMQLNLTIQRADDMLGSRDIMHDIWQNICNSRLVIADCTGRNPNVFYEIGVAHCVGTPVLLITQRPDDVPFDLRSIRHLSYEYTPRGMAAFESALAASIESMIGGR
jgi:hypothetical protein